MEDLAGCHKDQQSTMMLDIKTEMSAFQKKILSETVIYEDKMKPLNHNGPLLS